MAKTCFWGSVFTLQAKKHKPLLYIQAAFNFFLSPAQTQTWFLVLLNFQDHWVLESAALKLVTISSDDLISCTAQPVSQRELSNISFCRLSCWSGTYCIHLSSFVSAAEWKQMALWKRKAVSNCDARRALQRTIAHMSADKSDAGLCRKVDMLDVSLFWETKGAVHVSKQTWCWWGVVELRLWWDVSGQMQLGSLRTGDLCITTSDVRVCVHVCVMVPAVGKRSMTHHTETSALSYLTSTALRRIQTNAHTHPCTQMLQISKLMTGKI